MADRLYARHHHHCESPWENAPPWAFELREMLALTLYQGRQIMSKIDDLKPIFDAIATDVTGIGTGVSDLQAKLAALQASAGNPATATVLTPADQATLDAAVTQGASLKTALDGVVASLAAAATT